MVNKASTILVVDDHPLFRLGVMHLLQPRADLLEVIEATSQQDANSVLRDKRVDLAIVDICLPDGSGLELIRNQRVFHPNVRWLVLSVYDEAFHRRRAQDAGAHGYLSKAVVQNELLEAVQNVLEGKEYPPGFCSTAFMSKNVASVSGVGNDLDQLSEREMTVFRLIAEGNTVEQIANSLSRSRKTINAIRDRIRAKLKVKSSAELARYATQWFLSMAGPGVPAMKLNLSPKPSVQVLVDTHDSPSTDHALDHESQESSDTGRRRHNSGGSDASN